MDNTASTKPQTAAGNIPSTTAMPTAEPPATPEPTAAALDPTLTTERQAAAIDALDGKSLAGIVNAAPMPRILSTKQTAELLNISPQSVRSYARRGYIRRVYLGDAKKQAVGYSEESVRDYLEKITGDRPTEAAAV